MRRVDFHFVDLGGSVRLLTTTEELLLERLAPSFGLDWYASSWETGADGRRERVLIFTFEQPRELWEFVRHIHSLGLHPSVQVLEEK